MLNTVRQELSKGFSLSLTTARDVISSISQTRTWRLREDHVP